MNNTLAVQLLGCEYPIIQAPMAGAQGSEMAIAVSNAGGLGSLPCAMLSIDNMVSEIKRIQAATDKPYNLNFFCHQETAYDDTRQEAWQRLLKPYFAEYGATPKSRPNSANRAPFSHAIADAIEPFSPPVVSFHFGLPNAELIQRVKSWGSKILSSATTLEEALWLEARGVDGIIAQGVEAGGHRGMFLSDDITTQMGLLSLVSQLTQTVTIPVIAAGGIAHHRDIQALLSLGATAVQVGTSYLLCDESQISHGHRQVLQSEVAQHTALTNVFTGRPARSVVNRAMTELHYMSPFAPAFPHAAIEMTQLKALEAQSGGINFASLWCGQNPSGCKPISAYALTKQLAQG
ncbi:NAD(P)H-dependent flavin oxidoreductase [Marinomonas pollencensis]|uniref:Nitronate monooxygenase n=1 Tax=Marinomonas pollencensis TaxID=491954 RepID=A0A3E0DHK3_9GAMM|nr:nitronate monooxygenase [Marinomonas pollencensis]REG82204.1 nitronate monooxygenase [Marinomonas pollencensis]